MSEMNETIQVVELAGRAMFKAGTLSIQAIQFLFRLAELWTEKKMRLAYGELSLKDLLEKQAMMGDESVVFQVATQDQAAIDDIKKELTDRGISFSQLPDFDLQDGYTQFYALASDAGKLNAFFTKHEELEAGVISMDDYYKTVPEEEREKIRDEIRAEMNDGKQIGPEELKKREFEKAFSDNQFVINKNMEFHPQEVGKESPGQTDYAWFKIPGQENVALLPRSELSLDDKEAYVFHPKKENYAIVSEKGELIGHMAGEALFEKYHPDKFAQAQAKAVESSRETPKAKPARVAVRQRQGTGAKTNTRWEADRLKNDNAYKALLNSPGAAEITLNETLFRGNRENGLLFRVPGTKGKLSLEIPKSRIRTIDGGQTYTAILEKGAAYGILENGRSKTMRGAELAAYFAAPRDNLHLAKVVKKQAVKTRPKTL